jgi:hypothetical protein
MDRLTLAKMTAKLQNYVGLKRVIGTACCNTMFLELFEPDKAELVVGNFSTPQAGEALSRKLFGYRSIHEFLVGDDKYEEIPLAFMSVGDILTADDVHCLYICIGDKLFGVDKVDGIEVFASVKTSIILDSEYNITAHRRS